MVVWRVSRRSPFLAVAFLIAASLSTQFSRSAGAAQADCKQPAGTSVYGCVWTGPDYTGTMTLYEGTGRKGSGCRNESPRSAVNNEPAQGKARSVFVFYHHAGCEKGGKAFGVLGPQSGDPDLPNVQSYAWTKYSG
jgi:hypothetical protein